MKTSPRDWPPRGQDTPVARVLLVEDDSNIRMIFARLLEIAGAVVTATGSGRDAAALAARTPFDVVITDLGLPDISGEGLIRDVLTTAPNRPRVIVVTGAGERARSRARMAGADVVLTKPIGWSELRAHVRPNHALPATAARLPAASIRAACGRWSRRSNDHVRRHSRVVAGALLTLAALIAAYTLAAA